LVTGDWARVVEVAGQKLSLTRSIGRRVRAVNHAVIMFRGIVTKEAIR
jgi:hypothetical protein